MYFLSFVHYFLSIKHYLDCNTTDNALKLLSCGIPITIVPLEPLKNLEFFQILAAVLIFSGNKKCCLSQTVRERFWANFGSLDN